MNIFKGLSQKEIGIVVIVGTAIAIVAVIAVVALVSSFPISDESKWKILLGLGIASLFIGYWVLRRMPPKVQTRTPPSVKPNTHCHDVCNGANEINRNLSHIPNIPSKAIAISNAPSKKQPKTISALVILSSFHRYLIGVLHNVL